MGTQVVERVVEVPQIQTVERIVEVPQIQTVERVETIVQQAPQVMYQQPQVVETFAAPQVSDQQQSFGSVSMCIPTQTVGAYGGGAYGGGTVGAYSGGTVGAYGGGTVGAYGGGTVG